jgi:hypothetical protein
MAHESENKYTSMTKYGFVSCLGKSNRFCSVLVWVLVSLIYWEPAVRQQRLRWLECKLPVHLFHLPRLKFMKFSVQSRISLRDSLLFAANSFGLIFDPERGGSTLPESR